MSLLSSEDPAWQNTGLGFRALTAGVRLEILGMYGKQVMRVLERVVYWGVLFNVFLPEKVLPEPQDLNSNKPHVDDVKNPP